MIDLHCHILPGIDDGAQNLAASLAMLRTAEESGTTAIVATPHVIEGAWLPEWEDILAKCEQLTQAAEEEGLSTAIYPGAEVAMNLDILQLIAGPGPYCLNGGRYMLVELPAIEIPNYADDFFFTLEARGIIPVLAHPERHPVLMKKPGILAEWVRKGVMVQLNAPSLTGNMGEDVRRSAKLLLQNGLAHFIGSDAHSNRIRRPVLTEAAQKIKNLAGETLFDAVFFDNPRAALRGEEMVIQECTARLQAGPASKSGWLSRLKRVF